MVFYCTLCTGELEAHKLVNPESEARNFTRRLPTSRMGFLRRETQRKWKIKSSVDLYIPNEMLITEPPGKGKRDCLKIERFATTSTRFQ